MRGLPIRRQCAPSGAGQVTDGRSARALRRSMGTERFSRRISRRSLGVDARSVRPMSRHASDRSPSRYLVLADRRVPQGARCAPMARRDQRHGARYGPIAYREASLAAPLHAMRGSRLPLDATSPSARLVGRAKHRGTGGLVPPTKGSASNLARAALAPTLVGLRPTTSE
jgi:hypothetical protein